MLLTDKTKVKWNSKNKKHYVNLGYIYTKMGDEFEVNVSDLTNGSRAMVKCLCEYCNEEYFIEWHSYYNLKKKENNKDCCGKSECTTKKSQEVLLNKYNVINPRHIIGINEKIKETNIEKYGCENPFGNKDVQHKIKQYYIDNFGVTHNMQIEEVREKSKQTCIDRYGVEYYVEKLKGLYIGSNSPNWKGDAVLHERTERRSPEYMAWRKNVFNRDLYTCQCCGARNGNGKYIRLEAHHIFNWNDNKELRYKIDNGTTLCQDCHIDFHRQYGKKNNTKEQFDEFLNTFKIDKKIC